MNYTPDHGYLQTLDIPALQTELHMRDTAWNRSVKPDERENCKDRYQRALEELNRKTRLARTQNVL